MAEDRNDLAYWFPRLAAAGVPVPRTEIVATDLPLIGLCDGQPPEGLDGFLGRLRAAAGRLGYPAFLRTGHGSGKHQWRRTCYLAGPEDIPAHVAALVEWSALVDFLGLPTRTWAVREFLPLEAPFHAFDGMPVAREFRTFFRAGRLLCIHPYWPPDSIRNPSRADWRELLAAASELSQPSRALDARPALERIVERVAPRFDGAWSLDLARAVDGTWYAIDMAEMDRSFHWPGCPNAPAAPPGDVAFEELVASLKAARPEATS
jgi:hypothetical protein